MNLAQRRRFKSIAMADRRSSADCKQDVSSWVQSIVHYVKYTQAKCLDLRTVPDDTFRSMLENALRAEAPIVVNIEPILDSLVDSSVTEIHIENRCFMYNVQHLFKILVETNIEKLNFCPRGVDDIVSLTSILKETKLTNLAITRKGNFFPNNRIDDLVAHLVKSLKLNSTSTVVTSKVSILFRSLPQTQITCLDLSGLFFLTSENSTELLQILMSNLPQTAITDLNLSLNKLSNAAVEVLSAGLENSKLEKLNLSNNELTGISVHSLVPGLIRSKITHLNLGCNFIENAFDKLGYCLKDTKIKELNLSISSFLEERLFLDRDRFLQGLLPELVSSGWSTVMTVPPVSIKELTFSKLTHLDLSFNRLNLEQISALVDYLSDSELTHLNLYKVTLPFEGLSVLGEGLKKLKLKWLNVGGIEVLNGSVVDIAEFLKNTKGSTIASLNLRENNFVNSGYRILPILTNSTFSELDLSHNGWSSLVASLTQLLNFMAVTALFLDSNRIGDDGATTLSECLQETQVFLLSVKENGITSIGAKALALALKTTKLRHLNLSGNQINNDGLESLAANVENSCITFLNVWHNPGGNKLLVDRALWENRRKFQKFADLLKETAFFTGDSLICEFDRDFKNTNIDVFIKDCLEIYRMVLREPFIVAAIEQDRRIVELKKLRWSTTSSRYSDEVFFENCELLYQKILEQSSPVQASLKDSKDASFFEKQILWFILEYFPTKLVSFIGRSVEADVEQHVSLLRKMEELELTRIVELLLLNRPLYVIDKKQDILHPYVYKLIFKYKQTICNTEIEPEGVEKIIQYFTKNMRMKYALEVIMLLNVSKLQQA